MLHVIQEVHLKFGFNHHLVQMFVMKFRLESLQDKTLLVELKLGVKVL